ncbi:MAG: tyrosine-type recombinase/integrase [Hyphomicrobiaceae bacterium]
MAIRAYETKQGTRWAAIVRDEHGKQVWRRGFLSAVAASREEKRLLKRRSAGDKVRPEMVTFATFVKDYLERKKGEVAPRSWLGADQALRMKAVPVIGKVRMGAIRTHHLQLVVDTMAKSGLSPASVRTHMTALKAAFRRARDMGLMDNEIQFAAVRGPRVERRLITFPEPEMLQRLLAVADETYIGPLVRIALLTGMRRGEVLGLTWANVDLDRGLLRVGKAKTNAGRRTVSLGDVGVEILRERRRQQQKDRLKAYTWEENDFVFTHAGGAPIAATSLQSVWQRVRKQAGVPEMHFHDLRHAHVSILLDEGVDVKIVSERVGHKGVHITLDTYAHVSPKKQLEAAEVVDRVLNRKPLADD